MPLFELGGPRALCRRADAADDEPMTIQTFQGSCHCGAIRFEVDTDQSAATVLDCDCSVCTKKGILHLIVARAQFRCAAFDAQVDHTVLQTYTFGTHTAQHLFCRHCGMHPFYVPRSHPDGVDVNVCCLDGVPLSTWRTAPFHGADWEEARRALG